MAESVNIQVGGNVSGNIVVGEANFVVNTNYGSIVYQQAKPRVQLRSFAPQPPRSPAGFVDRIHELEQIADWMSRNELVLIHGPDGLGKSALLRQAGNLPAARAFQNGVIILDNIETQGEAWGPGDVVQKIFDALFESEPPLKVDSITARTYLSNTHPLILFDEVPLTPALQRILPDMFPQGALLMAMDAPLGAGYQRLALGPLPRDEAVRLLTDHIGASLTGAQSTVAGALCALLQDIPLALTITGNLIRFGNLSLEEAFNTLSIMPAGTADPVPAALDKVYRLAYSRLGPAEKKVLAVASQTPGTSMSVDWLAAALDANVDQALERLKAMGLLFANSPRLRLPPGFLEPARRNSALDENTVLSRLVDYLLKGVVSGPEFVREESSNLFGTLLWAVRANRPREVIALGRILDAHDCLSGMWDRWGRILDLVLEASRQMRDGAAEAWALHQLGTREIGAGSRERALDQLRQALEIRRRLGDQAGMAYTQHNVNFLIGPPVPPRGGDSKPQPPRPTGGSSGVRLLKFLLAILGVGFAALLLAVILPLMINPSPPAVVEVTTPVPEVFVRLTPTLTPPDTDTPTPWIEITITPTLTPEPTPIGGSGMIAFQSRASFGVLSGTSKLAPISIYILGIESFDLKNVALDSLSSLRDPAWSPDGSLLAFTANTDNPTSDIFVVDPNTLKWNQVTSDFNGKFPGNKSHPSWSPDGRQIVFLNTNNNGSDIFVLNTDGSSSYPVNLTNSPYGNGQFEYPEWSPDGKSIAFQSNVNGDWEIFTMDMDGSNQTQITKADQQGQASMFPDWSPDGSRIAFASNRTGTWDIYVMDRAGGNVQPLTSNYNASMPAWSPDDNLIAFTSGLDAGTQILVMNADGSGIRSIAQKAIQGIQVNWRPAPGR